MNHKIAVLGAATLLLIVTSPARADLLPNNFWINPTFESGTGLGLPTGTPDNWTRDGGDPTICEVITDNSVSSSHSLAVIDTTGSYGEWRSDVSLIGNATNGDVLNIQWFEMYNLSAPEMRLTVQFFDAALNVVGATDFATSGTSSAGWVSTIANSTFTKRNATLVVPVGAVTMRCALVSGGDPSITGVMVIDDLSVARVNLLPGNFWVNSNFESGSNLDQTNGTPANWTRGGGDPTIDQVTTSNSVSSSHSLAVIDNNGNSVTGYGEWDSDVSLIGNANPGDMLDIQWFQMYHMNVAVLNPNNVMRLTVQFFNASSVVVGTTDFSTIGSTNSPGWTGTIASSTFTKRKETLVVPPGAVTMRCSLVSGGFQGITGVMVIDDLSVARTPMLLPGNFWVNPTFELGTDLDQTNGTPANWTRGGGDPTIDQVTTSNSVSSSHSLAVIDNNGNSVTGYGEWDSDVSLIGNANPGDMLDIQWFQMYHMNVAVLNPNNVMRLTVQFFNASSVVVGTTDFSTIGSTNSPGWTGTIASSTFTKRKETLVVPAGAVTMRCSLVSAGFPSISGVMVIDDLSVARTPMLLPGNFWVNPTFELGTDLDQTNGTPANWTRGGGDPTIDVVTTNNSVSSSHSLAVIDNNGNTVTGYGEWDSDVSLIGNANPGDMLDIQWFQMYHMNIAVLNPVNIMRLTVQFFNASSVVVGTTDFSTIGTTNSAGWMGTIASSTFTK